MSLSVLGAGATEGDRTGKVSVFKELRLNWQGEGTQMIKKMDKLMT